MVFSNKLTRIGRQLFYIRPDRIARRRWAAVLVLLLTACAGSSGVAAQSSENILKRLTPVALDGNREALREVAKAIVDIGPREFTSASALRPRLRQEALRGSTASATAYAMMLQYGIGGAADIREAPSWYARGASTGNLSASKRAAMSYALGWGVRRDTGKALEVLASLEPEVRAKEMLRIGEALLQPGREEPDVALAWLRRAAALNTGAVVESAELYERLASADPETAPMMREWLRTVAGEGDVDAAMALGSRLMMTLNQADVQEAAEWFFSVAEKGDERGVQALTALISARAGGDAYHDPILAFLDKEAQAGSNVARISLAEAFSFWSGADADMRNKGRQYLTLAAKDGDPTAQYKLAMLLLSGEGGPADTSLAKAYLSLSAAKGNALAANAAAKVGTMNEGEALRAIEGQKTPEPR